MSSPPERAAQDHPEVSSDRQRQLVADTCQAVAFLFGHALRDPYLRPPLRRALLGVISWRRRWRDTHEQLAFPESELIDRIICFSEDLDQRRRENRAPRLKSFLEPDPTKRLIENTCHAIAAMFTHEPYAYLFEVPDDLDADVYTELHYPDAKTLKWIAQLIKIRDAQRSAR